jgi:hypothetical protein
VSRGNKRYAVSINWYVVIYSEIDAMSRTLRKLAEAMWLEVVTYGNCKSIVFRFAYKKDPLPNNT